MCAGIALLTLGLVAATAAGAEPIPSASPAAHDLAEKFSKASQPSKPSDEAKRRKAEEDEMLTRARAEAAARAASAARTEAAANSEPTADVATGAQDERQQIGQRVIVTPPDEIQKAESERQRALEAAREAEARALAEKLRRAEAAHREKASEAAISEPSHDMSPLPPPSMGLGRTPPPVLADVPADLGRVTVLLVMEPGNKGIRRFNKTADPVLCLGPQCYISTGMSTPARSLHRNKALGAANTLGRRAGACRQSLSCVFRDVRITGAGATIQPIDLKVLVHDRRAQRDVSGDTSCQVTDGALTCGRTIVAPGYRAWIVPERIADQAGAAALKSALARGLVSQPQREAAINLKSKAP